MQYIIIIGIIIYLVYLLIAKVIIPIIVALSKVIVPVAGILSIAAIAIGVLYALIVSIMSIVKSLNENNDPYVTYRDKRKDIPLGTRRSYYFGPGYHHIGIIVKGAFSNQKEYLGGLTSWRYNATYRLPWFVSLWVWIFYIVAWLFTSILGFIWVSIFSIIIFSVIFFGMCLFYVFFSLLWIADRFALAITSVQSRCPNDKRISIIPIFNCPNCGTGHGKLTPGTYGIFHRRCGCGYQLPTTFMNGRSKLKATCPYCATELAASDARQFGIQLIGAASSGKTTFLAAFWHLYLEKFKFLKSQVTYSKFPDSLFDELEEWFQKGFSSATSERNANMYSILHKHKKETPHQLTIYDIAGEAFGDLKSDQQQQQFKYCEGIIFVIDPDAAPNSANGTISSFTDEFKELRGAHAKKLSKIPLAVIISKSDLFEQEIGLQKIQSRCPSNAGQDDLENTRNAVCREFLGNHGFGNVVNLIDGAYDNVRYFPVSAMGHKAATGQSYNPWGVIEPVMWLLSYTKTSFKKIVTWLQTNKYPEAYLNVKKFIIRLLVLGLIGFVIYNFIRPIQLIFAFVVGFVQANLISVLIALGICIVCTLLCFYTQKKSKVPEFRLLLNILFSIGFIWLVFNFNTIRNINFLDKLQQMTANLFKKEAVEEVVPQEEPKAIYALVVPDGLNVRSRPSDTGDVIGVLYKNSRIEVIDSSGIWWKIKFRDIEGYVFSDLVKLE